MYIYKHTHTYIYIYIYIYITVITDKLQIYILQINYSFIASKTKDDVR